MQETSVRAFLGKRNILLNRPDDIHHVLVANPGNYRRSPASIRILRPVIGQGLLLSEGDDWKLQRRTIAPALAPRVMPMLARHIITATNQALAQLMARPASPLTCWRPCRPWRSRSPAGRCSRSKWTNTVPPCAACWSNLEKNMPMPTCSTCCCRRPYPRLTTSAGADSDGAGWRSWDTMLQQRLATPQPDTPRDLFDLLRAARDPETGAGFSPAQLRDQVATLILAGHETTAVTLFWALATLAQSPTDQDWLAEEAQAVTIDPETAHATVATLIRTRAAVNETLRLYPPAFTIVREAINDDRIGDLLLPPRSIVMIAPWVIHRHHALWEDPAAFRPSRFMPDQPAAPRFAFMPFGAGPRICVGAHFALTEAALVLAAVIGRFRVERADTRPIVPVGIVTTQPDHPAKVILSPRH